jgi:flap endonuclease-1
MIRNIANRQGPLVIVSGTEIRTVLQLDRAKYIDFALLLGTDFSQRIKNVGPTRALKFIREHGSIERVLELETKFPPRVPTQIYLEEVEVARLVYETLPPLPHPRLLQPRENDDDAIQAILERYRLHRLSGYEWDYSTALDGNYFGDNPSAF